MTAAGVVLFLCVLQATSRAASPVAGSVVSSKEWRVRRGAQQEEEFIGDVRYKNRSSILTADWALFKHASQTWQAKGRVRVQKLLPSGDILEARGDRASFLQKSGQGELTGEDGVAFFRTVPEGKPDQGSAGKVEWEAGHKYSAVGSVRIWGPRLEAWADRADYDLIPGQLVLGGRRPVLLKREDFDPSSSDWIGAMQGDVVTASELPRRLSADGKARGWLDFFERRKSP